MTYPDEGVALFLAEHFISVRLVLQDRQQQKHFREYNIVWTPTLAFLDRNGVCRYHTPGYLPPVEFLDLLRIGLARSLLACARYPEAATQLHTVALRDGPLSAEALYWLGMAYYLPTRQRRELMRAWGPLCERYPGSVWASRVPPGQAEEIEEEIGG